MMGKGSDSHNIRTFSAKHVDKERSMYNVEFCHGNIKKVYHKLFDIALERYNAKQKRNDRKIDNYYKKIERNKQEKLFHEVILQIGNKNDMNARSKNGQLAKKILIDFMEDFQQRNPYLYVFSAHLHMDEETPHVHIDFIPFIRNRGESEWNQWMESEKQELSKVMGRYGIQWKHLSVLNYKKQKREKEVVKLAQALFDGKAELSEIVSQQVFVEQETEQIRNEGKAIRQEVSKLSARNVLLRQETDGLIGWITEIGKECIL